MAKSKKSKKPSKKAKKKTSKSTKKTLKKEFKSLKYKQIKETIGVYDKLAKQYSDYTFQYILQFQLMQLANYVPKKAKILDIGCAAGRDVEYLMEEDFDVTGIDLSANLIKEAKKRVKKAKFEQMDMAKMDFKAGSFDAIWCHATLCHLHKKDVLDVLKEFKRVLKQKGIMYIGLRAGKGEGMVSFSDTANMPRLFAFYTIEELRALVEKAGFNVLQAYSEKDGYSGTWLNFFVQK